MIKKKKWEKNILPALIVACITLLALVLYTLLYLNHLMHSDMAAEVILSRLLADRGELISTEWFYSTEIRILYSQLVMTPLFLLIADFHTVKVLSVLIFLVLLILACYGFSKRLKLSAAAVLTVMMLLLSPWSNEYLDMMFLGNFYTPQTICMFLFLGLLLKERPEKKGSLWALRIGMAVFSLLLGLSGLRYLACLFVPLLLAVATQLFADAKLPEGRALLKDQRTVRLGFLAYLTGFAGVGFLINKLYLATHYSFDKTSQVGFVPIADVPGRALDAVRLMLELLGYRQDVALMSPLGLVNVLKCAFFLVLLAAPVYLFINRRELLDEEERFLLTYFIYLFLINLYMLVFTGVLQQYRYWIPVFVIDLFFVGFCFDRMIYANRLQKPVLCAFLCVAALSSLYGELWQDVKFDDCAKREGYMEFLEDSDYTFGYATFWNGPVTEYLSNGKIHVGNIGAEDKPYEWLTPKAYYRRGYVKGPVFMLLANTEEAGLLETDAPVMKDAVKVYGDEYYAIYEKPGMFLFSD